MTKSLRLNLHPREVTLAKILDRGERSFSDLHPRDKEIILQSDFNWDGLVPEDELMTYRLRRKLKNTDSAREALITQLRLKYSNAKRNLTI